MPWQGWYEARGDTRTLCRMVSKRKRVGYYSSPTPTYLLPQRYTFLLIGEIFQKKLRGDGLRAKITHNGEGEYAGKSADLSEGHVNFGGSWLICRGKSVSLYYVLVKARIKYLFCPSCS